MMEFGLGRDNPNKTPAEVINEGAFGGTCFRNIYSGVNDKWYRNSGKEFDFLRNVDSKYYSSNFYDVSVNKYGVKCGTSWRIWEEKGLINSIDPYGWFQWYCRYFSRRRCTDDARQIDRYKRIVTRFKGMLIKLMRSKNVKNKASVSPNIRPVLLH